MGTLSQKDLWGFQPSSVSGFRWDKMKCDVSTFNQSGGFCSQVFSQYYCEAINTTYKSEKNVHIETHRNSLPIKRHTYRTDNDK